MISVTFTITYTVTFKIQRVLLGMIFTWQSTVIETVIEKLKIQEDIFIQLETASINILSYFPVNISIFHNKCIISSHYYGLCTLHIKGDLLT